MRIDSPVTRGCRCGSPPGWTPAGRFSDFFLERIGESAVATWTVETFGDFPWSVAVYKNGVFVAPLITADRFSYPLDAAEETVEFWEFFLVPSSERYESLRLRTFNLSRRIRATWSAVTGVTRVTVHKNAFPSQEVSLDEEDAIETFTRATVSCSDARVTAAGRWSGDVATGEITCEVTTPGGIDAAVITWTYEGTSGDLIARDYAQMAVNGVTLLFSDDTYTLGETFTVSAVLPEEYTTEDLPNGNHRFVVQAWNNNLATPCAEVALAVSAVPGSPALDRDSISYTNGSGEVRVAWRMPTEVGIREAWVFRNYPEWGIQALHWRPIEVIEAESGNIILSTVTDLQPGLNRIGVRVLNDGEYNDDYSAVYELFLDESLNSLSVPGAPWAVAAETQSDLSVTLSVWAHNDSEEIEVYHDNRTGTIDYGTVFATIVNPGEIGMQKIESAGHILPGDGTYRLAARGKSGTTVEENTTVIGVFEYDTTLAAAVTGLALELV